MQVLLLYPPKDKQCPFSEPGYWTRRTMVWPSNKLYVLIWIRTPCLMRADPTLSLNPSSLSPKKPKSTATAKEQTPYFPVISVEGRLNWGLALQLHHGNYSRLQAPRLSGVNHKVTTRRFWLEN